MPGFRGTTWQRVLWVLLIMVLAWPPAFARAGGLSSTFPLPLLAVSAQSPLEAQMVGEKSLTTPLTPSPLLPDLTPGPKFTPDASGATLRLPQNFRVTFLYNREGGAQTPGGAAARPVQSPLLFRYSMDYLLLPNLQVGLSGFLYQPPADILSLQRRYGHLAMGWGPGIKYDLGRWSFTFRSQLENVRPEGGQDLQNWFRVWYAF